MQRLLIIVFVFCLFVGGVSRADLISGKVLDPDGKPVAGAQVWVQNHNSKSEPEYSEFKTNGAGAFEVELKPSALWDDYYGRALAYKSGFAPVSGVLRKGQNILRLDRVTTISGRILDAREKPVTGARVSLLQVMSQGGQNRDYLWFSGTPLEDKFTVQSDADGNWKIDGVNASGIAEVEILHPRFARTRKNAPSGETNIVRLKAGATLSGRIIYEDGKPAADIHLSAQPQNHAPDYAAWGEAKSAADGTFEITSLSDGSFNILVDAPDENWVAAAAEGAIAKTGESRTLPNLVFTKGALVEGVVSDDKGAPVEGAMIGSYGPHRPNSGAAIINTTSDEKGFYRLRVAPGKNKIYIQGTSPEFVTPEAGSSQRTVEFSLAAGETKNVPFVLTRGLLVTGIARDEKGAPVARARLTFERLKDIQRDYRHAGVGAISDENGQWKAYFPSPDKWKVEAAGDWEMAKPLEIEVPREGIIEVQLRRTEYSALRGRVVSPDGKPVAGAVVGLYVSTPEGQYSTGQIRTVTSDAQGNFALEKLRSEQTVSFDSAVKSGFRFSKGGQILKTGAKLEIAEIVLAPLNAKLRGRVLDAQRQPVENARVLSPDAQLLAQGTTNANGEFELENLAQGEITIIAVHPEKGALSTTRLSNGADVELHLTPPSPVMARDEKRAEKILMEASQQLAGENTWLAGNLLSALLPHNFERATELARNADGLWSDMFLIRAINYLTKNDPAKAAVWGAANLEGIKDKNYRSYMAAHLGVAVADVNRDLANQLFEQVQKAEEGKNETAQMHWISLAILAAKLERPETQIYVDKALELGRLAGQNEEHDRGEQAVVVEALAEASIKETTRTLALIDESKRGQALNRVIEVLVRRGGKENLDASQKFLEQLENAPGTNSSMYFSQAALKLIPAVGKTDSAAALSLARKVTESYYKPQALSAAARFQDDAIAGVLLREAGDASLNHQAPIAQLAQTAILAYPKFPALSRELVEQALRLRKESQPEHALVYGRQNDVSNLATALALTDKMAARELLELEWAAATNQSLRGRNNSWQLNGIVYAMANIDFERALAMAHAIPNDEINGDPGSRIAALRYLARWLLTEPNDRVALVGNPNEDE